MFPGRGVEDPRPRHSGFVGDEGESRAILREIKTLDLPGDIGGDDLNRAGRRGPSREPGDLRIFVGHRPDRLAIRRERATSPGNVLGAVFVEPHLLPAGDIDEPASALVDGERFADQELRAVGRPVEDTPSAAGILDDEPVGGGIAGIDHPDIAVGTVAARRGVGDPVAGPVPHPAAVLRAAPVGETRDIAGGDVEPVHLAELIPPGVAREEEELSLLRIPVGGPDRLGEEGELAAGALRHPHLVDLRRIPEAGADEHLHACWMPADEGCTPRLGIAAHLVGQGCRDLRDPLDDEVVGRADRGRCGRWAGRLGDGDRSIDRHGDCHSDQDQGERRKARHGRLRAGGTTEELSHGGPPFQSRSIPVWRCHRGEQIWPAPRPGAGGQARGGQARGGR